MSNVMKPLSISPALNGWIVQVGCQNVVFNDKSEMIAALSHYIDEPKKTEKRFFQERKNNTLHNDPTEAPARLVGAACDSAAPMTAMEANQRSL